MRNWLAVNMFYVNYSEYVYSNYKKYINILVKIVQGQKEKGMLLSKFCPT